MPIFNLPIEEVVYPYSYLPAYITDVDREFAVLRNERLEEITD